MRYIPLGRIIFRGFGPPAFPSKINKGRRFAPSNQRQPMTRFIRAAALQLSARDRADFERSIDEIVRAVGEGCRSADLLVLPEATLPAYVLGDARMDEVLISGVLERIATIARNTRTVIVAGAAAVDGKRVRNSAFVVDADGSLAGRADKLFLWHFDRLWFSQGERLEPVRTSIGTLGVLICADGRIPTIARGLVERGAEILVMPTAWVTSGRDPDALENVQADLLARVRAFENRVPFVAANKCGAELGMVAYCGKSQIIDSRGEIVAIAGQRHPETVSASVELSAERPIRASLARIAPRIAQRPEVLRIAISFEPLPRDIERRLEILGDQYALAHDDDLSIAKLDGEIPIASVDDAVVLDPAGLVTFRRAGYSLLRWSSDLETKWTRRLARARALELRVYLVVFERSTRRAYAVDPDGTVVAGTFGDFHLASFTYDARKTSETQVAPETDILRGLEYVEQLT